MVSTSPGSDRFSSGSDRSKAAPAACSMVPIAPSQTSTRSPDSSCATGMLPADDGPLMRGVPLPCYDSASHHWASRSLGFRQRVENLERHLSDQPVTVVVQPEPGDLLDPLDPVSHGVRVNVQQP